MWISVCFICSTLSIAVQRFCCNKPLTTSRHIVIAYKNIDRQTWVSNVHEIENTYISYNMKQSIAVQVFSYLKLNCVELGNKLIGGKDKGNCSLLPGLHQSFR